MNKLTSTTNNYPQTNLSQGCKQEQAYDNDLTTYHSYHQYI